MSEGQSASNELTPLGPPKIEIIFFQGWAPGGSGFWRGGLCGVTGGEDTLVTAKRKSFERYLPVMLCINFIFNCQTILH